VESSEEFVWLGSQRGRVAAEATTDETGCAQLAAGNLAGAATVLKCGEPDVPLVGARVVLLAEVGGTGQDTGKCALMVDDPWWGRRVQPAAFGLPALDERFTMGYRLAGRILHDGVPQADADISLEGCLVTEDDGAVHFWDSEEHNDLVYSAELDTYVAGPTVLAPVRTSADGRWSYIVPRGHGAVYQRAGDLRDESEETRAAGLRRYLKTVWMRYKGRKVEVSEGTETAFDLGSGRLRIIATPGAYVRVGILDDMGQQYAVPGSGVVEIGGLPTAEYGIVQFRLTGWGAWDASYGCPRASAEVREGETSEVTLVALEDYSGQGDLVCGRVYERIGRPAAGVSVVAVDVENARIAGTVATTDEYGYWSATVPEAGLGGELWVLDERWGCVPIIGAPYSDVVLGARAYSSWSDSFRHRPWRTGSWGHDNFGLLPDAVEVVDEQSLEAHGTEESGYGGWLTSEALPKYRYVSDVAELLESGPQLATYALRVDGDLVEEGITLRAQSFEEYETLPGQYRAAGYCPEYQLLVGGKAHGHVVRDDPAPIKANLPEAARVGLEFGKHDPYIELRLLRSAEAVASGLTDMLCPYCGGPAHRDPDGGGYVRGHCRQCADAFGLPNATDCRCFVRTPTVRAPGQMTMHAVVTREDSELSRYVSWYWRPELYDETDDFVTQEGKGFATNAPRWCARHLDELGDGRGAAQFDGDRYPPFVPGHDLSHFEQLPQIQRPLGLAQMKVVLLRDRELEQDLVLEFDCKRLDGIVETLRVTLPQGMRGPTEDEPYGDFARLCGTAKLAAEALGPPYAGAGLYVGVADIRLVSPDSAPGCRFNVVADVPFLNSPGPVQISHGRSSPLAVQVAGVSLEPHIFGDAVGQVFLFYASGGQVRWRRRDGLESPWSAERVVPGSQRGREPWADKDDSGGLVVAWQDADSGIQIAASRDDGASWRDV
jgi:hypothetical protein